MHIAGRTVLVTGAASGIGAACSLALSARGARVVAVDIDGSGIDSLVARLPGSGHRAVVADVGDVEAVCACFAELAEREADLGAVVNAAGILTAGAPWPVCDVTAMARTIMVNAGGAAVITTLAARFPSHGPRVVVNVASAAAVRPLPVDPAYALSKAGVVHFSRSVALAVPAGFRVAVVLPGVVDTPMVHGAGVPDWVARFRHGPLLQPVDVATAVADLIADDSSPDVVSVELEDGSVVTTALDRAPGAVAAGGRAR